MVTSLGEKNALADYLKMLKQNKLSYAYSHAYLSSLLFNKILKNFEWESAAVREKVMYICFFHDISLKTDTQMQITTLDELEKSNLSRPEKDMVMNHALLSAGMLDKFPKVPIGVGVILKEYHGIKTGYGFREGLSIGLSPLSMMFVVVEDFVSEFLKIQGVPSKDQVVDIFTKLEKVYNKVTYAQTIIALQNSILNQLFRLNSI